MDYNIIGKRTFNTHKGGCPLANFQIGGFSFPRKGVRAENCVFSTSRALSRSRTAIWLRQPSPTFRAEAELFAFCMVIISVISLTVDIMRANKKN